MSTGRPSGNYNLHQKNGWFGKGKQYNSIGLDAGKYDNGYGTKDTHTGVTYSTDDEMTESRREQQIAYNQEEAVRLQAEDKLRDELKQPKKERAPRRKAMKKQYQLGETVLHNGEKFIVQGIQNDAKTGKLQGYIMYSASNEPWYMDRFGEVKRWI